MKSVETLLEKHFAIEILNELLGNSDDEMSSVMLMKKHKAMPEDYTRARNLLDNKLDKLKEGLKKE